MPVTFEETIVKKYLPAIRCISLKSKALKPRSDHPAVEKKSGCHSNRHQRCRIRHR